MEVLRNLFGTLTSGVVRLLVTVGILAATYFFIVKPVLNSANDAIDSTNQTIQKSFESSGFDDLGKSIKRQINHSFQVTKRHGGNPQKLIHCVQNANGNVNRIQRCTRRF
jgi:hypothetical protein